MAQLKLTDEIVKSENSGFSIPEKTDNSLCIQNFVSVMAKL